MNDSGSIEPRPYRVVRLLSVAKWPRADRSAWLQALQPHDVFDPFGRASRWAAATQHKVQNDYARWLSWISDAYPHELELLPIERITPTRVAEFAVAVGKKNLATSVASSVEGLWMGITTIEPSAELPWLRTIVNHLSRHAKKEKPKSLRIRHSAELFSLGLRLMDEAESDRIGSEGERGVLFRDGLMIALLAARPIRLRNLHMMRIETHLVKTSVGYCLVFERTETKRGLALQWGVPPVLTPRFDRYLTFYRPTLLGRRPTQLHNLYCWLAWFGKQLGEESISSRISAHTLAAFGVAISPHLFRHCAVTSIAVDDPAALAMAPNVLGNSGFKAIELHYNQATMLHAARRYQACVAGLRVSIGNKAAPDPGPAVFLPGTSLPIR